MYTDWLRDQTAAFANAVDDLDLDKQVVTCPEWSVRVLVAHIGTAHRRAAGIVRTGAAEQFPDPRNVEVPRDPGPWLREGAAELADAVAAAGDKVVWSFLGRPMPASFWLRRMLHDTAVHAVDAAITAGLPYTIPAQQATDGIDEGLELITHPGAVNIKPDFTELRGTEQTIQVMSAEGDEWLITRTPDGPVWERAVADSSNVTVSGNAQDLLLLFYGRLGPDAVTVTGERDLITHWLAYTAL